MDPATTPLRLSVAMINYNYGRYLPGALDSVLSQTRPPDEVVVVDDGSTDDSREVLARYADRVRVVEQENQGAASASNAAISACTGDVVLLLDSDDLMAPRRCELVGAAYEAHPEAQWVWHRLEYVDRPSMVPVTGGAQPLRFTPGVHDHRAAVARGRLPMTVPATSALSWRREFLRTLLPIPAQVHVHDNYLKLASMGLAPGVVLDGALSIQGIHDANITTGRPALRTTEIRANSAVDFATEFDRLGLSSLSDRFIAIPMVRPLSRRLLTADRRSVLRSHVAGLGWRRRRGLARAVALETARAGRDQARSAVARLRGSRAS